MDGSAIFVLYTITHTLSIATIGPFIAFLTETGYIVNAAFDQPLLLSKA